MRYELIDDEEMPTVSQRGTPNAPSRYTLIEENDFGASDYLKDATQQVSQGLGIGALGTYGDIFEMLGLNPKDVSESEKDKYSREFATLEKMEKGEVPSSGELMGLSEDDLPRYSRLPTSQDVESLGKEFGLVSEPESAAGRYAKRIGKLASGSLVTGLPAIKAPIVAGLAGQTIEEAGGPPWMQAAAEIIASLKFAPKTGTRAVTSKSPEVEQTLQNLRNAGFAEQDLTLAKNALEERKLLKKFSKLTPEAENTINKSIQNSETLLKDQIAKGLPGYAEGGLTYLEKQASNVYKTMEEVASSVPIKNSEPMKKAIDQSIKYLEKYPLLKEQKEFIEFMKEGLSKSGNANTAEFYTGFYRNLNRAGNWGNPTQKEHILGIVKKGIKETFDQSGPEAKKFGEYFEKTNEAWKKWLDAKDVMSMFEKAITNEGINFKKVSSILNDPETYKQANKVLGPQQIKNIEYISKGAQHIESLLKQIPSADKSSQTFKMLESLRGIISGDFRPLAVLIGMEGAKRLATDVLINPKKQNIMLKIIDAAKNKSPQQAAILAQELIKEDESKTHSSQAKEKQK